MSATRSTLSLCAFLLFALLLSSCGSSSGSKGSAQAPIFSTTPPANAAQGTAYSYQVEADDPSGGTVTFAMPTAPTGASLSGSTISWTPTAAQSRTSNSFVVTATTSEGGTANQSWSVSPTGVVTVNWVNTYWEASGPVQVPVLAEASLNVSAIVPDSDGSLTVLKGETTGSGVISIAGVPAGNYWLQIPAVVSSGIIGGGTFWTNATTIDAGRDIAGSPAPPPTASQNQTDFVFNLSGLDSVSEQTPMVLDPQSGGLPLNFQDAANSTSLSQIVGSGSNEDWTQVTSAFLAQYTLTPLGPITLGSTGSSAWLTNLAFTNGATNSITESLSPATASLGVTVQGSQWVSTFTGASVSAPASYLSGFSVVAEPYVIGVNAPSTIAGIPSSIGPNLVLAATPYPLLPPPFTFIFAEFIGCDQTGFFINAENTEVGITTDENLGTLEYSDPLPTTWTRAETFCDEAVTPVATPNSSNTGNFALVTSTTAALSSSPLTPIVSPVQSPTINNASLFTAATLNTTTPSLSWSAPANGTPYGYAVSTFVYTTSTSTVPYVAAGAVYTSQTSVTLPPLSGGNTYVFSITALVDGAANIQTSPYRSALPTGYASVVSAPITISSSAPEVKIHGDARMVRGLSQPRAAQSQQSAANQIRKDNGPSQ